ncbi:MAG: MFS transporter [Clostridiales bacterium]|nr:MFS transporter [Clostridiales bacterium]
MKKKFDYKWVIVGLSFLMVFTCLGFCSSNKSIYLSAITEALQIKRSLFAIGDSCRFITTAVVNMFFGTLVNRFGTKKLIFAGFICLISSMLIYSVADHVIWFYVGSVMLGIGLSWTTTSMVGCIIKKWCSENRGTIMGAVLAANGLGGALATQIVTSIIYQEGNIFGYRDAYRLVAIILVCVMTVIMIFMRENPKENSAEKNIADKKKARGQNWSGIDFRIARTKPYYYIALVCVFFTGMTLQGITGCAAAHMKDVGIDPAYVGAVLSIHSLALTAFKFLTGMMYDRFGLRFTMTICQITAVAVMLLLAFISASPAGHVMAMVYGIFSSLALPLETIMLPIFASDMFGDRSFNKILGIFVSVNTAGYAVGSPIINGAFDIWGTYKPMLIVFCLIMAATTVVLQLTLTVSNREKRKVIEKCGE